MISRQKFKLGNTREPRPIAQAGNLSIGARALARINVRPPAASKSFVKPVRALKWAKARAPFGMAVEVEGRNPAGVRAGRLVTHGSAGRATLGWRTQSRWDCGGGKTSGLLFQPFPQFSGIPFAMPNGQHFDLPKFPVDRQINQVRPWLGHPRQASQTGGQPKSIRSVGQRLQKSANRPIKSEPNPRLTQVIPVPLGFGFGDDFEGHFPASNRFLISAEISSIGVPRPGFFNASSARRSKSAICSGVSSSSMSPNSAQTCSATSYCSSGGNRRICSNISTALIPTTYRAHFRTQADLSPRARRGSSPLAFSLQPLAFALP